MDRPKEKDEEDMYQSAREDALTIPIGPMTRSRTKKLKEAVGELIKKSLEQGECLGRGLIWQETLITIQSIPSSS
ncbi:hypothetical protein Bca4012_065480 [Brassica carinata]